jgi:hypothetical protein
VTREELGHEETHFQGFSGSKLDLLRSIDLDSTLRSVGVDVQSTDSEGGVERIPGGKLEVKRFCGRRER